MQIAIIESWKAGVAILMSDNTDNETKNVTKNKVGLFIIINVSIHQEDIIIIVSNC